VLDMLYLHRAIIPQPEYRNVARSCRDHSVSLIWECRVATASDWRAVQCAADRASSPHRRVGDKVTFYVFVRRSAPSHLVVGSSVTCMDRLSASITYNRVFIHQKL